MDDSRLVKLREELEKARKKRDDWEAKVKDLERRYNEAEKVYVYGIFQTANMTPEQLAELIRAAAAGQPYNLPADAVPAIIQDDADDYLDDIDEEKEEIEG